VYSKGEAMNPTAPTIEDLEELSNLFELDEKYDEEEALDRRKEQEEFCLPDGYKKPGPSSHEGYGDQEPEFDPSDEW
jgi:hypothetical protein